MKKILAVAAACLVSLPSQAAVLYYNDANAFAARTVTTLESFETEPWSRDTPLGTPVRSLGASWQAASELRASTFQPFSGWAAISDIDTQGNDPLDHLTARFDTLHEALGFMVWSPGRTDLLVELLDSQGAVLHQHTQRVLSAWTFMGWTSEGAGVQGMRVSALSDGMRMTDDFILDDARWGGLTSTAQGVPVPATLALAGLGLVLVGWARKKATGCTQC